MAGVEIFRTYDVMISNELVMSSWQFFIPMAIAVALAVIASFAAAYQRVGLTLITLFLIIIPLVCIDTYAREPIYETHMDAIISEDVSLTEFAEKYEIVDIDDKIYVIKEKEDNLP